MQHALVTAGYPVLRNKVEFKRAGFAAIKDEWTRFMMVAKVGGVVKVGGVAKVGGAVKVEGAVKVGGAAVTPLAPVCVSV